MSSDNPLLPAKAGVKSLSEKHAPKLSPAHPAMRIKALLEEMTGLGVRAKPNANGIGSSYIFKCTNQSDLSNLSSYVRGFLGLNTVRTPNAIYTELVRDSDAKAEAYCLAVTFQSVAGIPWSDEAARTMAEALYIARAADVSKKEWPSLMKEQRPFFRFEDAYQAERTVAL